MRQDPSQGAGLVLLSVFAALLAVGILLRFETSLPRPGDVTVAVPSPPARARVDPSTVRFIEVRPGWRIEQIGDALERAGIARRGRFLDLAADPNALTFLLPHLRRLDSLEGYLFPGLYEVGSGFSEASLIRDMIARFEEEFSPQMRERARAIGLSVHDVVTLASIVEREIATYAEAPIVAGIFLRRLRAGIPLQANPTVVYAVESTTRTRRRGYWLRNSSAAELGVDSPFNTYLHEGLPPGPIAGPSREAIAAVLYPANVPYLYFVAKRDGTHAFARTLKEHKRNIARYSRGRSRPFAQEPELQQLVERVMSEVDGRVGVLVKNLATGEAARVNANAHFTAGSLYKLIVMLATFELRERGALSFEERLSIPPSLMTEDDPTLQRRLGATPTIAKAAREMIVVSNNAAGQALFSRIGRRELRRIARSYGLKNTFFSQARIVTTPRDVARLLELTARGRAISRQASAQMRGILLRQEIREGLPQYLQRGTRVAHKTAASTSLSHDAGILYTSRGSILLVALTEDVSRRAVATESIAILGKVVQDYFESYRPLAERIRTRGRAFCGGKIPSPRRGGPLAGKKIVLDPGHGGIDDGATFRFSDRFVLKEKELTLHIALRLARLLANEGAMVGLTRCQDVFLPQMARAVIANEARPDIVVSVHLNGSDMPSRDGTEVYYFYPDGRTLASSLLGSFARPALWETLSGRRSLPNLGVRRERFTILVHTLAPIALTESLFLTNPAEAAALRSGAPLRGSRRDDVARGIFHGILHFFGATVSAPPPPGEPAIAALPAPSTAAVTIVAAGNVSPMRSLHPEGAIRPGTTSTRRLNGDVVVGTLQGQPSPADARWLRRAGFTVLNIPRASDYAYGTETAAEAIAALDQAGLLHAGRPGQMARQEVRGVRVAVLGVSLPSRAYGKSMLRNVRRLVTRADAWSDLVVVAMEMHGRACALHSTAGGSARSWRFQPAIARAAVDAGADLVVGYSDGSRPSHTWYKSRLVACGLGEFRGWFEQKRGEGSVLRVTLGGDGTWRGGELAGPYHSVLRIVGPAGSAAFR